jgi:hypothetical protein
MNRLKIFLVILLLGLAAHPLTAGESVTVRGMKIPVNGSVDAIDGVPLISLWGTPWEQGFAYGYLYQEEIVQLFNDFLDSGKIMNLDQYERSRYRLSVFKIPSSIETEMRGMMAGIEIRAGGLIEVPAMKRPLRYEDLVMANVMGELSHFRMACSSFAAWGPMTADGDTLSGRNYEWPLCESLLNRRVVVVRVPPKGSARLGTVNVYFPGLLGIITGMNEEGVTLSTHDSTNCTPTVRYDFTPNTLLYRELLETAHAETLVGDAARLFGSCYTVTGNSPVLTRPYTGREPAAFAFEHDACLDDGNGFTVREPVGSFFTCTNRYYKRGTASKLAACWRYDKLNKQLKETGKVDIDKAWKLLESVALEGTATYHRVIFEPNKRKMHVAFPADGEPVKIITLDVAGLLAEAKARSSH